MVVLETRHSILNSLIGEKLSLKELEEILFNLGYELEDISGDNLRIDITAERPDLLSTQGLARALRAYLGFKNIDYKVIKSKGKIKVENTAKEWPFVLACIVKGLKFDDEKIKEVIRIQEKLGTTFLRNRKKGGLGLYPLDKIKFPVKYTSEEPKKIVYRPLEYSEKLNALEILQKHPTGIKYKYLVNGWKRFPIFIDSNKTIMSMPPIVNSHDVGKIDENTKDVFVEVTGKDLKTITMAFEILVGALMDMGGKAYSLNINYGNKIIKCPEFKEEKRKLNVDYVNKILGLNLKTSEIKRLLEKMMYKIKSANEKELKIIIPSTRRDIWHDIDVVDDIMRAYGCNNFELNLKSVESIGETTKSVKLKEEISNLFIGLGYQEVFTLMLTNKENQFRKMNIEESKHINLGKSVEQSVNMARNWLLPELINCLHFNRSVEYPHKIFEINHVVLPDNTRDVMSKDVLKLSIVNSHSSANFTEIKQILDYLANSFSFKYDIKEIEHGSFINGRAGNVIVDGSEIGVIGEISPVVLGNFGLEAPVSALELDLNKLFNL